MVNYITSITVLTYGLKPLVLLVLRRSHPDIARRLRLPMAGVLAPSAFICSNWIIEWTGFETNSFLFVLIFVGFVLYALHYHVVARRPAADFGWRHISWLFPWFVGMWVLSALGGVGGGWGALGFWPAVVLVAIWSLVVLTLAQNSAISPEESEAMMQRM